MTYKEAVKDFKELHADLYVERVDYWTAFECWDGYKDMLNREGAITDKQYNEWSTPFPYGKRLEPNKRQLELELDREKRGW